MMHKRGMLFVVGMLLVMLFLVRGEELVSDTSMTPETGVIPATLTPFKVAELYVDTGDVDFPDGCDSNDNSPTLHTTVSEMSCFDSWREQNDGCSLYSTQGGTWASDDSECAGIKTGFILRQAHEENNFNNNRQWGSMAECTHDDDYASNDGNQYLCSDDNFWTRCSLDDLGVIAWGEGNILYNCTKDPTIPNTPIWQPLDTDVDHDGFIRSQDCDDNPGNDPPHCTAITAVQCGQSEYSGCAVCQNPGAAERCGDTLDNDCNEDTSDDCNQFAAGCENRPLDVVHGELEEGELSPTHTNIYGETFSWTDTGDGGYCCGYGGINDLGKIVDSPEGNRLCLHSAPELVGRVADTDPLAACSGWCWLTASLQDNAFHIFTIKKPGESSYDVVSNNNDWIECRDEPGTRGISATGAIINPENIESANRFYCYKEGNHWSWADCRDPDEASAPLINGIKERQEGDGSFAFPLTDAAIELEAAGRESFFIDLDEALQQYYGLNSRVDFTGLTPMYLEFFIRFRTLHQEIPPEVRLQIFGPEQAGGLRLLYLEESVLGYAMNTPLLEENRWMHIQIPLREELYDVEAILIESITRGNLIEIRNVYLSSGNSPICSGDRSNTAGESSWLTDLDFSSPASDISGEKLCNVLFDPQYESSLEYHGKAWLGDDTNIDQDATAANCCGNNENEYYAGQSQEVDGKNYGCWNSEPIASGQTTMNVEFEVQYLEEKSIPDYPPISFEYTLAKNGGQWSSEGIQYKCPEIPDKTFEQDVTNIDLAYLESDCHGQLVDSPLDTCTFTVTRTDAGEALDFLEITGYVMSFINPATRVNTAITGYLVHNNINEGTNEHRCVAGLVRDGELICNSDINQCDRFEVISNVAETERESPKVYYLEPLDQSYYWKELEEEETKSAEISFASAHPLIVESSLVKKSELMDQFHNEPAGEISLINSNDDMIETSFYDASTAQELDNPFTAADLVAEDTVIFIMAKIKSVSEEVVHIQQQTEVKESLRQYVCHQEECLYPLPGAPPYTIVNPHPSLYELYFIGLDVNEQTLDPVLITPSNSYFTTKGMVKTKKVAQQVIFVNEGEEAEEVSGFYGCQAAEYIERGPEGQAEFENLNYCAIKAGKFCAYSVAQEDQRAKFTTINSWSEEPITKVGYQPITEVEGDVNTFYASTILQLRETGADLPYEANERNYSATALPARNFIPNAQFIRSANVLPHWEIRLADGTLKTNLRANLVDEASHSVTLTADETLRSEQIAVPQHTSLFFSSDTTPCIPTVELVTKDGVITEVGVGEFNSGDASYISLEFVGPCTITNPDLQVVDELEPMPFTYIHQDYPDAFDARAGAACCPQNYCWNGYACVEPMGTSTYLAEHLADGRDYRCIEGQWKKMPLQFDWIGDKWGFCTQQEQCLVLPSTVGGNDANTAADFYMGNYPTCINSGEYIFDHLCDAGKWTSRTKFVATKLLEVGENDDYVLYCTDYRQALIEFDNRENYLGGEFFQASEAAPTLGETLSDSEPAGSFTCFDTISDPQGRRLVSDEENTCVNNVCVLRFKEGGDFKVAFATTLNKNITNEDSFLFALNVPQDQLNQLCAGTGPFVECDVAGLDIPGNLWYSSSLNAIMYGREGLQITPSIIDRIAHWFSLFIGVEHELSDESAFVAQAQNFRDVYVLNIGEKKIRALKEILSEERQTLIAEYEHFDTPVCDYVNNLDVPPEAQTELLEGLSGQQKVACSSINGTQRVEAVAALEFFWPQLTGRLRVS